MDKIKIITGNNMMDLENKVNCFLATDFEQLSKHKEIKNIQYYDHDKQLVKHTCIIWYNYE